MREVTHKSCRLKTQAVAAESRQRRAIGSAAFGRLCWHLRRTGDLDRRVTTMYRAYHSRGLERGLLQCGACALKTSRRLSWLARSGHSMGLSAWVASELFGPHARARPNSALKSDIYKPVARRSILEHRARHFRRGGLRISIVDSENTTRRHRDERHIWFRMRRRR